MYYNEELFYYLDEPTNLILMVLTPEVTGNILLNLIKINIKLLINNCNIIISYLFRILLVN